MCCQDPAMSSASIYFALRFKYTRLLVVALRVNRDNLLECDTDSKRLKSPPEMASICYNLYKEVHSIQLKLWASQF